MVSEVEFFVGMYLGGGIYVVGVGVFGSINMGLVLCFFGVFIVVYVWMIIGIEYSFWLLIVIYGGVFVIFCVDSILVIVDMVMCKVDEG